MMIIQLDDSINVSELTILFCLCFDLRKDGNSVRSAPKPLPIFDVLVWDLR